MIIIPRDNREASWKEQLSWQAGCGGEGKKGTLLAGKWHTGEELWKFNDWNQLETATIFVTMMVK